MNLLMCTMFILIMMGSQTHHIRPKKSIEEVERQLKLKPYELFNPYAKKDVYTIFNRKNSMYWSISAYDFDDMGDDQVTDFMEMLREEE